MGTIVTAILIALVSTIYATAGQAGGTAFLAIMAFMGVQPAELRPTALALNVIAAGYATWRAYNHGTVDWRLFRWIAIASLPGAFAGGLLVLEDSLYFTVVGVVLIMAAVSMVSRKAAITGTQIQVRPVPAAAVGVATGFLSGLTGVGGGVFLAPILIALAWTSPKGAASLSPPFILVNSIIGLVAVLLARQRLTPLVGLFAVLALIGAVAGTWIGLRFMSERATKWVLASILLFVGIRLLLR
ncbi:sulfite exporter TauE/SafE family protein [Rhizobium jaguaris]|uniref:sulfite exporter TauE/SafE family protein n=1 Tax=Rhizobium jaguaris TaxID=1312183 RepID=UPI001FDF2AD7|nr:sulfite exporter TauE/SafE family protein [Rhizobium jaguaris]